MSVEEDLLSIREYLPAWIEIVLEGPALDEYCAELIEVFQCSGAELLSDTSVRLFRNCLAFSELEELVARLSVQANVELLSLSLVEKRDWVADSEENWEPFEVGSFQLFPVLERKCSKYPANALFVRPGMGFGTGRHPTTAMLLECISAFQFSPNQSVLDVGTGSGILGLAAYRSAQIHGQRGEPYILGLDIDADALLNACSNRQLNGASSRSFPLIQGELDCLQIEFDIIFANLYSELLKTLSSELERCLRPSGTLLLSGILQDQREEVEENFVAKNFLVVERKDREGWCALSLRKESTVMSECIQKGKEL
ncbi:MAG: 50S ribosomal protein L11 methyltransferase [Bdellovibrionales bacterium]|nr:50S ribosomal protein L11 methyltransferase [Bdellovibrionales bacterium]